jgi:hypothetical protein
MITARRLALAAITAVLLSGCSTINSLTGQTDNTVLPGKREDAVPGRTQFPEKPDANIGTAASGGAASGGAASGGNASGGTVDGNAEVYCAPDDPSCKPPETTGETFKDPQ